MRNYNELLNLYNSNIITTYTGARALVVLMTPTWTSSPRGSGHHRRVMHMARHASRWHVRHMPMSPVIVAHAAVLFRLLLSRCLQNNANDLRCVDASIYKVHKSDFR